MDSLSARRAYGLELCESRLIDEHEYRKARLTLYRARRLEQVEVVVGWLEQQPEWGDAEFHAPEYVREEVRDQELINREISLWQKNVTAGKRSLRRRLT